MNEPLYPQLEKQKTSRKSTSIFGIFVAFSVVSAVSLYAPTSEAQATNLVDITNSNVPHDVPQGLGATTQELAVFAWQEFVALNWPALDPATTGIRGRPDTAKSFDVTDPGLTVWQTYRHRNEQFPFQEATAATFDSHEPSYKYAVSLAPATPTTKLDLFDNLDESSQITLAVLCANNVAACGREIDSDMWRILFEAKVNRAAFDYANSANLTDPASNYSTLVTKRQMTAGNLAEYGGICSSPDAAKIVMLPCGDNSVSDFSGEGAIETKAAWRRLTPDEMKSGRFHTAEVMYYEQSSTGSYIVHNETFGLVGLHIIHKTVSFPAFVYATWEQVDDYNGSNTSGLRLHNTGTALPDIAVVRDHAIPQAIEAVNDDVHGQLSNVWQYYKLVNVQAKPMDGPPAATAPADTLSYYYMANIVIETNQTLQNFYGGLGSGGLSGGAPLQNVYEAGTSYEMGGCQGCHGAAGQHLGGDMSVLLATAPFNVYVPEAFNDGEAEMVESRQLRFSQ